MNYKSYLLMHLLENTDYSDAHKIAQKNAALPIEKGGLGLHPENTAKDRANAMGFTIPAYHFSRHGIDTHSLDSSKFAIAPFDAVGTHFGDAKTASERFDRTVGNYDAIKPSNTYPVLIKNKPYLNIDNKEWDEDSLNMHLRDIGGYNDNKTPYNRESALKLRGKVFDNADHIPYINDVEGKGKVSYIAPPKSVRSVFAAFDPMKKDSENLLD